VRRIAFKDESEGGIFRLTYEIHEEWYENGGQFLPLSVWKHAGWDEELIRLNTAPEDVVDTAQGGRCYRVRIRAAGTRGQRGQKQEEALTATGHMKGSKRLLEVLEKEEATRKIAAAAEGAADADSDTTSSDSSSSSSSGKKKKNKKEKSKKKKKGKKASKDKRKKLKESEQQKLLKDAEKAKDKATKQTAAVADKCLPRAYQALEKLTVLKQNATFALLPAPLMAAFDANLLAIRDMAQRCARALQGDAVELDMKTCVKQLGEAASSEKNTGALMAHIERMR
jgi:hypothetical protein